MKKITFIIILTFLYVPQSLQAQKGLTENFNFKIGMIGGWLAYEKPLSDSFLLDIELGYIGGVLSNGLIFTSIIELEPRYYYNLNKRIQKSKNTKNNSANYLALQLSYIPSVLTIAKKNSTINILETFSAIPTFGFRRNISGGLNFDFEVGVGYMWTKKGHTNEIAPNLLIGFSYVFK